MGRRTAIIDMLARHRAGDDEAEYQRQSKALNKLSTGLLLCFLDEEQRMELDRREHENRPG